MESVPANELIDSEKPSEIVFNAVLIVTSYHSMFMVDFNR